MPSCAAESKTRQSQQDVMASTAQHAKTLLEMNDDVLYLICCKVDAYYRWACSLSPAYHLPPRRLLAVALTCRRLRKIAAPLLYRTLTHTDEYKTISHRPSLGKFLSTLETSEMYAKHARILIIHKHDVYGARDVTKLAALLSQLEKLVELKLVVNKSKPHAVAAFSEFSYTNVERLTICTGCEDTISSFPNIRALRIKSETQFHPIPVADLFRWSGSHSYSNLRHFDLTSHYDKWTPEFIRHLATSLPLLEHVGTFQLQHDTASFEVSVAPLAQFPRLRSLKMGGMQGMVASYANVEFMKDCGKCHLTGSGFGPCDEHRNNAVLHLTLIVLEACAMLEAVEVAQFGVVVCTRAKDGTVEGMEPRVGEKLAEPFKRLLTK